MSYKLNFAFIAVNFERRIGFNFTDHTSSRFELFPESFLPLIGFEKISTSKFSADSYLLLILDNLLSSLSLEGLKLC